MLLVLSWQPLSTLLIFSFDMFRLRPPHRKHPHPTSRSGVWNSEKQLMLTSQNKKICPQILVLLNFGTLTLSTKLPGSTWSRHHAAGQGIESRRVRTWPCFGVVGGLRLQACGSLKSPVSTGSRAPVLESKVLSSAVGSSNGARK